MTEDELRQWFESRKEAGRTINIDSCEIGHWYAYDADPYDANPDLPEEAKQIGSNCFVRGPKSRGWVHVGDLPPASGIRIYKERINAGAKQ
jgi:hypothetical protein